MHIAAASPPPLYVAKEEVPAEVLEKEKEIYKAQAARRRASRRRCGRRSPRASSRSTTPPSACSSSPSSRTPKLTVGQLVQEKIALIKENIVVRRFARFRVGEEAAARAGRRRLRQPASS